MKKVLSIIVFLSVCTQFSEYSYAEDTALIKVSSTGKATALPDQAQFNISFSKMELEVESAHNVVNAKVKSFVNGLDKFELETQSLDSGQIHISPQYNYKHNERFLKGYQVNRTVTFVLNQLNQLQDLISFISKSNISSINNIKYQFSNEELLKEEALNNAIRKATKLAETIAEGFNVSLSSIHSVTHHSLRNDLPNMRAVQAMTTEIAQDAANINIKPIEIESHIEVEFNFDD